MHRKLQWVKSDFRQRARWGAGCEITENDADVNLGVEMVLLVKEAGGADQFPILRLVLSNSCKTQRGTPCQTKPTSLVAIPTFWSRL